MQKKKSNFPKLEIGDNVRVSVINKIKNGYKDSFSMETDKIEDVNRGLYTVPVINKVKKRYKDSFSMETHKVKDVNRGLYTDYGPLHTNST